MPRLEYAVVLVILAAIIARGYLAGIVVGLVLAVVLFAISYGRVELVREVAFGQTYRSNVDRPPAERAALGPWPTASRSCGCTASCSSVTPAACWNGSASRVEA